jgi:hypothetical protein
MVTLALAIPQLWLHLPQAHEEGMTEKILADHKKHKFLFPPKLTSGGRGKGERFSPKPFP